MAVVLAATSLSERFGTMTITGTGLTAATDYIVSFAAPGGSRNGKIEVTTDGAGAFTTSIAPQARGTFTFFVRPASEYNGTTTALGTTTAAVA